MIYINVNICHLGAGQACPREHRDNNIHHHEMDPPSSVVSRNHDLQERPQPVFGVWSEHLEISAQFVDKTIVSKTFSWGVTNGWIKIIIIFIYLQRKKMNGFVLRDIYLLCVDDEL